jgi:hypothetical protein
MYEYSPWETIQMGGLLNKIAQQLEAKKQVVGRGTYVRI